MKCEDCRFWRAKTQAGTEGKCRRSPPAVTVIPFHAGPAQVHTRWPETAPDDWCGEHAPATAKREKSR